MVNLVLYCLGNWLIYHIVSKFCIYTLISSAILQFYSWFNIPHIVGRMLVHIWESHYSASVSGQFVILVVIFNIVLYWEISSGLHSSVIGFYHFYIPKLSAILLILPNIWPYFTMIYAFFLRIQSHSHIWAIDCQLVLELGHFSIVFQSYSL